MKKLKEGVASMPPSSGKGGSSARISPARSSSRGQEEHPHLHLRDPDACLDELLEPVAEDQYEAVAAAVQGQVEALLEKFHSFVSAPLSGDVADPVAGDEGEDNISHEVTPSAGDGGIQG